MKSKPTIGTADSKRYRCCNHPDRPARLPSHVLCAECFAALDVRFRGLAATPPTPEREPGR